LPPGARTDKILSQQLQVLIVPTVGPFLIDPVNGDAFRLVGPATRRRLPATRISLCRWAWSGSAGGPIRDGSQPGLDARVLVLGGALEQLLGRVPPPTYAPTLVRLNSLR
jgi:hypothetical protein